MRNYLYYSDLEQLWDALIDYPSGVNFTDEQKAQVVEEIQLRAVWAE